jgi:predicted Zn finger-like uncharacterized protein
MKIICANCQKSYHINGAKVPPRVKAAKCKSCGHLIPLKRAASDQPDARTGTIEVSCRYCGKSYVLRQDKIPPGSASFRCKSCRHAVPLKQKAVQAPTHPLKQESLKLSSDIPAIKEPKPYYRRDDTIRITCPDCQKKYRIPHNSIPSNAIAFNCRICEHKISLPSLPAAKTAESRVPTEKRQPEKPPLKDFHKDQPQPVDTSRKKLRLMATAAGVLLVVVLGILAGYRFLKLEHPNQVTPRLAEEKAESSSLSEKEPFTERITMNPTEGPVETSYIDEPHFVTIVDVDTLKPKIQLIIEQSLFPGHFWNFGENPQMALDLDTVDIPNAALAELTYQVASIRSPDGEDVLRMGDSKLKTIIHPGSMFPGSLSLSIKKETPPEALGTARIRFHLSLPIVLEVFEFKADAQKGSVKTGNEIRVTLERLEKDVAQISCTGGQTAHLFAYDRTGKSLASGETMNSSSIFSTRFQGVIDTLKVVVADKMLEYPFDVEVDLNAGKELTLSKKPEIPVRIRYNHKLLPMYVDLEERDLDNLTVVWKEAADGAWNDNLFIQMPEGPFSGHAVWEVHFFGKNKPLFLTGNPIQGMRDFSFRLDKGQLKNASAAFGKIQLDIKTGIKRLVFVNNNNGETESSKLPSGNNVQVRFNKNEVTYSTGSAEMIQTSAYDAAGSRLRQDNYMHNKGDKHKIYFWGLPARFVLDFATRTVSRQILFDIKQRPLEMQAYQAFKQAIENQREIVTALKKVDRARRKDLSYYGDDLAGLYYLYDRNKKKPMQLIDKTIAQSDPAGQKRFHYMVKPFKGYFFTVLSGVQANGVYQEYQRRPDKSEFMWQGGTIKTNALTRHPDLVAIPEDKSQPTFFLQWGQVYMKPLYGLELDYLPENFNSKGWSEAKFIEG